MNLTIWFRNSLYFAISFTAAGFLMVQPQARFIDHPNKEFLLALVQTIGTFGAMAGIAFAQKFLRNEKLRSFFHTNHFQMMSVWLAFLFFTPLFYHIPTLAYILLFLVGKFFLNFALNLFDQQFAKFTLTSLLATHSRAVIVYQLLGILIAPLYFSWFTNIPSAMVITLTMFCLAGSFVLFLNSHSTQSISKPSTLPTQEWPTQELSRCDFYFLAYSLCFFALLIIFSGYIIYLLKDFYQFQYPISKGALLIAIIQISAIVGVSFSYWIVDTNPSDSQKSVQGFQKRQLIVLLIFFISFLLFFSQWIPHYKWLLILSIIPGTAFGVFEIDTRSYATRLAHHLHHESVLSHFNNIPNYAALVSFSIMVILSLVSEWLGSTYAYVLYALLIGFLLLSFLFLLRFRYAYTERNV